MPYFVLFSNIIADPYAPTCFDDLQLLRKVVYYFLRMHTQHRSARKLEQIAETFTRLAESFVRGSMNRKSLDSKATELPTVPIIPPVRPPSRSPEVPSNLTDKVVSHSQYPLATFPSINDAQSGSSNNYGALPAGMDLRNLSGDLADPTLLGFLSYPMDTSLFANENVEDTSMREMESFTGQGGTVPDPLLHQLDFLSTEQSLNGNFDWFSWDTYAWNGAGNGI